MNSSSFPVLLCLCMNRISLYSIFFALGFAFIALPNEAFAFSGAGAGTLGDPFIITTCDQLQEMEDDLGAEGNATYYRLNGAGNTIDCSASSGWNGGLGFDPIGSLATPANIFLFANGNQIADLAINRPEEDYVGLFGYMADDSGVSGGLFIGGTISGNDYVGLVAGYSLGDASNVTAQGFIDGNDYVGGAFGYIGKGTYSILSSLGGIFGQSYVGGLAGYVDGAGVVSVNRSLAYGGVIGYDDYVGGLIGYLDSGFAFVSDSYARVNVAGDDFVGGAIGFINGNNDVDRIYAVGPVYAENTGGGLVAGGTGTVEDSFWDTEASGYETSAVGGAGKTTAEMQLEATFTDTATEGLDSAWDFDGTPNDDLGENDFWTFDPPDNDGYPLLNNVAINARSSTEANIVIYFMNDEYGEVTSGNALQSLDVPGGDATAVTIGNLVDGFDFDGWSDGTQTLDRDDDNPLEATIYVAQFSEASSGMSRLEKLARYEEQQEAMRIAEEERLNEDSDMDDSGEDVPDSGAGDESGVSPDGSLNENADEFIFPFEARSPFSGEMESVDVVSPGDFVRGENYSTVYYIDEDYKRRAFVNSSIYFTYANDFDGVITVTDATLGFLKPGPVMLPAEGSLVKWQSIPDVYVVEYVDGQATLRHVEDEEAAAEEFGENWAQLVIDLPDTFFGSFVR